MSQNGADVACVYQQVATPSRTRARRTRSVIVSCLALSPPRVARALWSSRAICHAADRGVACASRRSASTRSKRYLGSDERSKFGLLSFIYGTVVTSAIALAAGRADRRRRSAASRRDRAAQVGDARRHAHRATSRGAERRVRHLGTLRARAGDAQRASNRRSRTRLVSCRSSKDTFTASAC